ncbi:MAG: serine/threonine-protein kinase [Myxococcota bacterium]
MEQFGRYVLVERIAAGGMAEIWRGASVGVEGFSRPLAIKRILPEWVSDPEFVAMLVDEARIASSLHHPNVIQVTDLGTITGQYFIAMEYVAGKHLGHVIGTAIKSGGTLPLPFVLLTVRDALLGLGHAHGKTNAAGNPLGIVHRDISPQNLLVGYDGSVRVADFGIAKAMGRLTHTDAGRRKGKYAYMSPEQARADELDGRSDLYAMGVVLWESLAGRRLYPPQLDHLEVIAQVSKGVRRALQDVAPQVPADVVAVVERALAADKAQRFPTAEEFATALSRLLGVHAPGYALPDAAKLMKELFGAEAEEERRKLAELESLARRMTGQMPALPSVTPPPTGRTPSMAMPAVDAPTVRMGPPVDNVPTAAAPTAPRAPSSPSLPAAPRPVTGSHARPRKSNTLGMVAGGLLLVAGVAAVAAVMVLPVRPSTTSVPTPPPPAATPTPTSSGAAMSTTQVTFESNPPGAVVAVDGVQKGVTPLTVALPSNRPTRVVLERHAYEPSVLEFTPTGESRMVMVELRPAMAAPKAPKKGAPPGLAAPAPKPSTSSGPRPAQPTTTTNTAPVHEPPPAAPASPPGPKLTEVTVESRPSGAQISINGKTLGSAPLGVLLQPKQRYEVRAELANHKPVERELEPSGDSYRVLLELEPLAGGTAPSTPSPGAKSTRKEERYVPPDAVGVGTVSIFSSPPAHVFIDGKPTGEETPLLDLPVTPGKHTIGLINADEGLNTSFPVEVEAGKNQVINKKLR